MPQPQPSSHTAPVEVHPVLKDDVQGQGRARTLLGPIKYLFKQTNKLFLYAEKVQNYAKIINGQLSGKREDLM
jgi:hypothetical protein